LPSIGIIANPASGKDIRRLVSYATTIDNQEKVNIVKRIILAAQAIGVDEIYFMPDTFQIGFTAKDNLILDGKLNSNIHILDMPLNASSADTTASAARMEELGVGCIVVLGGDGTSRAAAKGINHTPLLPLSTGTNNVYPSMIEGTVAGMAAAAVATMDNGIGCCIRDKRVEVFLNGVYVDMALVDAVISDDLFVGSRAIWDMSKIQHIVVTRCHPASIGFSAVAGCARVVRDTDEWGLSLKISDTGESILAPVAAGVLDIVKITQVNSIPLNTEHIIQAKQDCMIALDGEREIKVKKGDNITFKITRNGPMRVKFHEVLEQAALQGLFRP
jgi:predicted polyphosphate/ATP-dependent NAD kinase